MSITYTAILPVRDPTVLRLSALLYTEQQRLGTRAGTRALTCYRQAVLVLRWLIDGTRMSQLAQDNTISTSTGYQRLHEGIDVLAAQAPSLHTALLAAKAAGYDYVLLDGTVIETDRVSTPGPSEGVDLWWAKKHKNHGGNIQVITAPDGWPLWTSPVRPGREHDATCLRTHPGLLDTLKTIRGDLRTLTDLGDQGGSRHRRRRVQTTPNGGLTLAQQQFNQAHNRLRAVGERGNSLLKTTFKALRNVSLSPWKISKIVAAALVVLHIEHDRTT